MIEEGGGEGIKSSLSNSNEGSNSLSSPSNSSSSSSVLNAVSVSPTGSSSSSSSGGSGGNGPSPIQIGRRINAFSTPLSASGGSGGMGGSGGNSASLLSLYLSEDKKNEILRLLSDLGPSPYITDKDRLGANHCYRSLSFLLFLSHSKHQTSRLTTGKTKQPTNKDQRWST